jgi:ribosomal protection tetracycline resistance protein
MLNLGILAHVDAGKTTLTERLLFAAGVIDEIGSVDAGTTRTDSLALERRRGITIKSAVASFAVGGIVVNLIDTPGHPDFIAEVERVLSVLDGAILVISAVEGVQPQTRVLMRALQRLRIPVLFFVNKIDRAGADAERVLAEIARRLSPAIVPMGFTRAQGARAACFGAWGAGDAAFRAGLAETLAENDEAILAAYVGDEAAVPYPRLRRELAAQTGRALVHPVFFGSAITGAGTEPLMAGLAELLPTAGGQAGGPVAGRVFKIERTPGGEKVAYVRMFSGTVRARDRLSFDRDREAKVTAVEPSWPGATASVSAGEIGKLRGLAEIQVGDQLGPGQASPGQASPSQASTGEHHFDPPTLESVVVPSRAGDRARLRVALGQLAEQDPLINVRQDDALGELSVSLYGEVQKEVIQATLADDFGVHVTFRETTTIHVERLAGRGAAAEFLHGGTNPFLATLGLRVDPAPAGAGLTVRLDVDVRMVPMYIYKTTDVFTEMMTQYVRHTLREGLAGWQVPDCAVTVTDCGYVSPSTTAADFRKLTPLVLMAALEQAGTVVCEPMIRVSLEIPADTTGIVLTAVARLGGVATTPSPHGDLAEVAAVLPAARAQALQRQLPSLTSGEGVIETTFGGYRPVRGTPPTRPRTMADPLNREEYLRRAARHTPALRREPDRPRRAVHPAPRCGPDRPRRAVHPAPRRGMVKRRPDSPGPSADLGATSPRARASPSLASQGPLCPRSVPDPHPVPVTQCDIRVVSGRRSLMRFFDLWRRGGREDG